MKRKRVKRSEATWREMFARQAASGMSVTQFCQGEGINASLFRRWRSTLTRSRPRVRLARRAHKLPESRAAAAPFIDLGGLQAGSARFEVRLDFGGGMVLSIGRG